MSRVLVVSLRNLARSAENLAQLSACWHSQFLRGHNSSQCLVTRVWLGVFSSSTCYVGESVDGGLVPLRFSRHNPRGFVGFDGGVSLTRRASRIGWSMRTLNPTSIQVNLCSTKLPCMLNVSLMLEIVRIGVPTCTLVELRTGLTDGFGIIMTMGQVGPSRNQTSVPSATYPAPRLVCDAMSVRCPEIGVSV